MKPFKSRQEVIEFMTQVVDTSQAVKIAGFSRQYINKLVKSGKLEPIKQFEKTTLFLRSDIETLKQS